LSSTHDAPEFIELTFQEFEIRDGTVFGRAVERDSSKFERWDLADESGDRLKLIGQLERLLAALKAIQGRS
jgi:hypothetical protein